MSSNIWEPLVQRDASQRGPQAYLHCPFPPSRDEGPQLTAGALEAMGVACFASFCTRRLISDWRGGKNSLPGFTLRSQKEHGKSN